MLSAARNSTFCVGRGDNAETAESTAVNQATIADQRMIYIVIFARKMTTIDTRTQTPSGTTNTLFPLTVGATDATKVLRLLTCHTVKNTEDCRAYKCTCFQYRSCDRGVVEIAIGVMTELSASSKVCLTLTSIPRNSPLGTYLYIL